MPLIPITAEQAQSYEMGQNAPAAALQQPGASLGQTIQSTQTSGAEAANLQAQNPGIQAQAKTEQVQALQKQAQLGLSSDLKNKMTLPSAISKYTALGMKADDVFNQYLAESPWGFPDQSPTELAKLGISDKALGQPGQRNTYADRWNARQAILGLNGLQSKWKTVDGLSKLGVLGISIPTPSSQGYDSLKAPIAAHIASVIPGAPGGETTAANLTAHIPDVGHIAETEPGAADQMFTGVKQGILTATAYKPEDLGLTAQDIGKQAGGNDLLGKLLKNAGADIGGDVSGLGQEAKRIMQADATGGLNAGYGQAGSDMLKGILGEYSALASNPVQHFQDHPVNTVLDAVPFLKGLTSLKGAADAGEAGDTAAAATAGDVPKAPGKLQQIFNPTGAKNTVGNQRDAAISAGQQAGNIKNGDAIAADWKTWGESAKAGNMSDADAIDKAVKNAQKIYGGKTFTPQQLFDSYKQIENGYTAKGIPKAATNAYIDRASQDILQKHLEDVAPGFKNTTDLFSQIYKTEKGQPAKIIKNLPGNIVKTGLNVAGLGVLRDIIGL